MATYGPKSPSPAAITTAGGGTVTWLSPEEAAASDDVYASAAGGATDTTDYLKALDFGFAVVSGEKSSTVTVEIERKSPFGAVRDLEVKLVVGGAIQADNQADTANDWPSSDTYKTYTFNVELTAAQINASDFGVVLMADIIDDMVQADVDHIRITVETAAGGGGTRRAAVLIQVMDED